MKVLIVLLLLVSTLLHGKNFTVHKDLSYTKISEKSTDADKHLLDIYAPKDKSTTNPVLVFIHGGSWNSGKKDTYKFLGKGFAKKGIVTVIINYRLTPEVNYLPMTMDCAAAVRWVYDSISRYGGDPTKIIIAGHSAG
jgi:acetyl esterase/lipase